MERHIFQIYLQMFSVYLFLAETWYLEWDATECKFSIKPRYFILLPYINGIMP